MKTIKTWIYLTAGAVLLSTSVHAEVVDRIVAIVNGDVIILSELNAAFGTLQKRIEASSRETEKEKILAESRRMVLDRMIDNLLIDQESKKSGIVIKDEEVMETIKDILSRRNMSMDDLLRGLAREGASFDTYKKEVKEHLLKMRLLRREIKSRITVSDEEIGNYYNKHRQDYEGKEAVRIKQIIILLPKDHDESTKKALREKIDNIHRQLKKGESFDLLAARYSQGPAAHMGGDIGFVEIGLMLPEVEKVAFGLSKDEISDVIESPVGFHIIRVIDKRGAGLKPIATVRDEIIHKIEEQKMDKKYEEWIKELRNKSHIEIKL